MPKLEVNIALRCCSCVAADTQHTDIMQGGCMYCNGVSAVLI
jgi:hypothetical protein